MPLVAECGSVRSPISWFAVTAWLAGCSTALIHLRFGINTLLAGILVLTMLYSIDLRIMGRSNIALFTFASLFKQMGGAHANDAWRNPSQIVQAGRGSL